MPLRSVDGQQVLSVCCCALRRVENALDLIAFEQKHGLPLVCKPVRGFGSVGVTVLRTQDQMQAFLASGMGQP